MLVSGVLCLFRRGSRSITETGGGGGGGVFGGS